MKIETYLPQVVTLSLLILSAAYRSPLFGYASALSLAFIMVKETYDKLITLREQKIAPQDEVKKAVSDMNIRVARIEHGIATRGF